MQNRFGVKDFFLFLLVIAVLVSVWLSIQQTDRQWVEIQTIKDQISDQSGDIRRIQDRLARGVAINGSASTTQSTSTANNDPFDRIEAARARKGYAQGDWLVWATQGALAKVTPLISTDLYSQWVYLEVLDTLATMDPQTLDWKPSLAKSWQVSDDGLKMTFQLREGLQFSDGQPLTADDVVFSYDFIMNPKINCPREKAYDDRIKSVKKTGPLEVVFTFGEPYFKSFEIAAGSLFILPKHFYGQFTPEDFNNSVGYLLGSGPYRMEDPKTWKPGQLLQVMRNERYWGVQPGFNRILFKEITNDKARLAAFRNGDTDFLWAYADQYREMLQDRSLVERSRHFEFDDPLGGYRFMAFNEMRDGKPTYFHDKRVRQAMTMLLDRQRLIQEAMYGYARIASGPFWPMSKQADPSVKPLPYDVPGALRLLEEAGFRYDPATNVLHAPDGKPFQFTLTYPSGSGTYDLMVVSMKDAYAKAGIVMAPQSLEWGSFTDRLDNKNFDAITLGWSAVVEDDPYQIFHSSQAVPGGDNFVSFKDPEVDRLIEEARRTINEEARMKLWHQLHRLLNEDQPFTFLFFPYSLRFLDGRIDNVQLIKLGLNPLEEWFVPLKLQRYRG